MIRVIFELDADAQKKLVEELEPNPFRSLDLHQLWVDRCAEIMPLITVVCLQCGETLKVDYPETIVSHEAPKAILREQVCECEDVEDYCDLDCEDWDA